MVFIKLLKDNRKKKKRESTLKVKDYQKIYQDVRWIKIKKAKRISNPVCEICDKKCITSKTQDIHHIIPFKFGLDNFEIEILAFTYENTMSVCKDCHYDLHTNFILNTELFKKLLKR